MNTISFISANYVARELGYHMTEGWGQGDKATNDAFRPIETFGTRFDQIVSDIGSMGFQAMDIWLAHLNPAWATDAHIAEARDVLAKHQMAVISLGGAFGDTLDEFEASCKLAAALDVEILGGSASVLYEQRDEMVALLKEYGVKLAIENHPEKTPEEMLAKIGDGGDGTIGTAVDTGWYGTQGYDAAQAIERLGDHVMHVHLKDVSHAGAHDTCRFGQGVVPTEGCVRTLQKMGYGGVISIEHEPETFDPTEDCLADLAMLRGWLTS